MQCLKLGGQHTKGHSSWQWCVSTTAGLKYRLALSLSLRNPSLAPSCCGILFSFFFLIDPCFLFCLSIWERHCSQKRGREGGVVFRRQSGVPLRVSLKATSRANTQINTDNQTRKRIASVYCLLDKHCSVRHASRPGPVSAVRMRSLDIIHHLKRH